MVQKVLRLMELSHLCCIEWIPQRHSRIDDVTLLLVKPCIYLKTECLNMIHPLINRRFWEQIRAEKSPVSFDWRGQDHDNVTFVTDESKLTSGPQSIHSDCQIGFVLEPLQWFSVLVQGSSLLDYVYYGVWILTICPLLWQYI